MAMTPNAPIVQLLLHWRQLLHPAWTQQHLQVNCSVPTQSQLLCSDAEHQQLMRTATNFNCCKTYNSNTNSSNANSSSSPTVPTRTGSSSTVSYNTITPALSSNKNVTPLCSKNSRLQHKWHSPLHNTKRAKRSSLSVFSGVAHHETENIVKHHIGVVPYLFLCYSCEALNELRSAIISLIDDFIPAVTCFNWYHQSTGCTHIFAQSIVVTRCHPGAFKDSLLLF